MSEEMGMIKRKGDCLALAPERFLPMEVKRYSPHELLGMDVKGWAVWSGIYWVIVRTGEGKYARVPFAKSGPWFDALCSDIEWSFLKDRQIYITGTA